MKNLFIINKQILLAISLSMLSFSSAYALPTINYGYPNVNQDLNECLSAASNALPKSGYKIIQKTKQHILGQKGKFFIATIVCATYRSGIAFIVVNGRGSDSNPVYERELLQKNFSKNIR